MTVKHISAVTLAVRDMADSVDFYRKVGLELSFGGEDAAFSSFRLGRDALNLVLAPSQELAWWGRAIFRVEDVDSLCRGMRERGLDPESPRDGEWGERYFHITDPDGHELSFAEPLR
jgi:catechol 2,3-dioxygenase-like lactoylglutathione lyase family enzyme